MKKGLLATQQTPTLPVPFSQFGLLDCDAPGSERRRWQRRIAEDELEALRRGLDAARYPGERSHAVAHVDGAEPCEDRAAIRVDGAAAGFTHNVYLLRLTEE